MQLPLIHAQDKIRTASMYLAANWIHLRHNNKRKIHADLSRIAPATTNHNLGFGINRTNAILSKFKQTKLTMKNSALIRISILSTAMAASLGFLNQNTARPAFKTMPSPLYFFDKVFEEEGMLGKGITVGKVQVGLISTDRSSDSIYSLLERKASSPGDSPEELARLANDVCLTLMRKSDDWISACSTSKWFSGNDAGKAESYYNDLANGEAVKFEKVLCV